jgi:outer membrane protein insertion porin family
MFRPTARPMLIRAALAACIAAAFALPPGLPAHALELYRIDAIDFEGNSAHTANELRLTVQLTEGGAMSKESIKTAASDDVHRLYGTGFFSDVRASADFRGDHTATVTYILVEQPQISEIVFSGLRKIDEKTLRDVLTIAAGSFLNDYQLKRSEQAVLSKYLEEGYYFAKVTIAREPLEEGKVRLRFNIEEGEKLKVGRFEIGFDKPMGPFSAWRRRTQIKWHFATGRGAIFSKELLNNDIKKFVDILKEKGFLLSGIEPRTEIDKKRKRMNVRLVVRLGPRIRVGQMAFEGNEIIPEKELRTMVTL